MFQPTSRRLYRDNTEESLIITGVIRAYRWSGDSNDVAKVEPLAVDRRDDDSWLWIDMIGEDPTSVEQLCTSFGIAADVVAETMSSSNLPMLQEHFHHLLVVLQLLQSEGSERLGTAEVDVFLGPDYLITIHERELPSFQWMHQRLDSESPIPDLSPALLLAYIASAGARRYMSLVQRLEAQIDQLEDLAIRADPRTLTETHALRRDVILLRRVFAAQREVYDDLTESIHPILDDSARVSFTRVVDHQTRVLEAIEAARAMLTSVIETHRGAVADQTNEIVRLLTVFSAVLLPLGLIAGMWGMNFMSIPGAARPWGFWIMIGVMALIALGLWVYFARRGFIGAPRLRDLPKAAGIGLFHVGTAPIRAVAGGIGTTRRLVNRQDDDNDEVDD